MENFVLALIVLFSLGVVIIVVAVILYVAAIPIVVGFGALGVVLGLLLKTGEVVAEGSRALTNRLRANGLLPAPRPHPRIAAFRAWLNNGKSSFSR